MEDERKNGECTADHVSNLFPQKWNAKRQYVADVSKNRMYHQEYQYWHLASCMPGFSFDKVLRVPVQWRQGRVFYFLISF